MNEDFREDVAEYLKTKGWNIVLVADHGIRGDPNIKFKYEYFMQFLGSNKTLSPSSNKRDSEEK
jgi:hypothetical protein